MQGLFCSRYSALISLSGVVLNWSTENLSGNQVRYSTICEQSSEAAIKLSTLEAADYALKMLGDSINDDSLYCLFEWDESNSTLSIVVTDHSKANDGRNSVEIHFSQISDASIAEQTEAIKFWLRDHLTTSADFMKYSLVAGFTRDKRQTVELM